MIIRNPKNKSADRQEMLLNIFKLLPCVSRCIIHWNEIFWQVVLWMPLLKIKVFAKYTRKMLKCVKLNLKVANAR